ncbi:hypothetical protein [Bacterioplanoides sp. SCSIO 12839]|uniref:hypothetical protein n=1 Tax=Bacterioplanoides sp. SCSIO 12839 TaxID=2829569 RepID=UPI0021061F20|nr:hypothetical protein [Bacterioplanoides sp. SCSIO 12839]UTW47125.1 hypothetical protein KFF03_11045 [Bacterioplanoides sp. SCSIO 12839]
MFDSDDILPVLSLIIAALAVFVGPFISSYIASKQLSATNAIAKKNIIAPIRQNWINELRIILSSLTTTCAYFWTEEDEDKRESYHLEVRALIGKLELYINANEEDHQELLKRVTRMESSMFGEDTPDHISGFWVAHRRTVEQSQKILKLEWERVKHEI